MSTPRTLAEDIKKTILSGFIDGDGPAILRSRDLNIPYVVLRYTKRTKDNIVKMLGENCITVYEDDSIVFMPYLGSYDRVQLTRGMYLICNTTATEYFVLNPRYMSSRFVM